MMWKRTRAAWTAAIVLACAVNALGDTQLTVKNLRCEYKVDPMGIDVRKPRLSWELVNPERGVLETSYEIRVAQSEADLAKGKLLWDSGKQSAQASIQVEYGGPALESRRIYYWQVRVADNHGHLSDWSQPGHWEMGLLQAADWKAKWITPNLAEDETKSNPAPLLRREFSFDKNVERARLYATAMGLYEMSLNGKRVGDEYFTPGWTAYNFRYQYQTYDVTGSLKNGTNCLAAMLGDGWFRGRLAWDDKRNSYGKKLALLAQLVVTYKDGTQQIVGTDDGWKSATGAVLESDIYNGETYDARLEQPGWNEARFDDKNWKSVTVLPTPKAKLVAPAGPPVKAMEQITAAKVLKTPGGDTVLDMGQNMVGWIRFRVTAPAGTTITLRHAEVLDKAGNFYTANLRSAKETIRYTAKGQGTESFQPHFTFQGFRYVSVSGWPGEVNPEDFTGMVVHSAVARTGSFEASNPLLNQLQHNIIWGQKGNFLDVPTDCPQRDERLGWTGDAQVFSRTAAFNMDVAGFFTKWLKDLAADQFESGSVPHVVPNVLGNRPTGPPGGSAAWADAAVIIPWNMYLTYGDKRVLEEQYDSMARWVEYERARAGDDYIWSGDSHFGDWLAFATSRADYPGATTSKDLIATAFFAHSTDLLQRAAQVLGMRNDAERYAELLAKIKSAFCREFVTETGRVGEATQTAHALALQFDLLPESLRAVAAKRLANEVRTRGHLTTGFVGTPYLCHVLSRYGYLDEAYLLLNRDQYPSWLYPVKQGATTIWERWDGQKPDGTFQDKSMNSFNHYAYGAVGDWMYRVMAGLEIDEAAPGYKHILVQPQPGGGFTRVKVSHQTPYGRAGSAWEIKDSEFFLAVEIPPKTRATVRLPGAQLANVKESGQSLVNGNGITSARQEGYAVTVELGSGTYRFAYPRDK